MSSFDTSSSSLSPPVAKKQPHLQYYGRHPNRPDEARGHMVMDPPATSQDQYQWMRDDERKDEEVLAHLRAENAYCEGQMSRLAPLTEALYGEMLQYLKESDEEVPHRAGEFEYFTRTVKGLAYTLHCRRKAGVGSECEKGTDVVMLDENELVTKLNCSYLDVGALEPSPSHSLMAYAIDTSGYETYNICVQPIPGGECPPGLIAPSGEACANGIEGCIEALVDCGGEVVWGSDDSCLFYTKLDDEHRPHQVWLHLLGTPQSEDILLFQDDDSLFNVCIGKTQSGECIVIASESIETSEAYVVFLPPATSYSTDRETSQAAHVSACQAKILVQPREVGLRYDVDHHDEHLLIVTNEGNAKNGKLVRVKLPETRGVIGADLSGSFLKKNWEEIRPYDPEVEISSVLPFRRHVAVFGRAGGGQRIWIYSPSREGGADASDSWLEVTFEEECYSVFSSRNRVYDTDMLRIKYSSMLTPQQVLDINMVPSAETGTFIKTILKQKEVPGYDASKYRCCRIFAPSDSQSPDQSVNIPISIVFRKSLSQDQDVKSSLPRDAPVLMSGYGSYGCSNDPHFSYSLLPLLDRGVAYAVAHIRGGGEMGRALWYEEGGKYFTKMNTFDDFACCGKYLQQQQVSSKEKMAIVGRSAGGLLIGATINLYPDLFQAAVADVPFVDVLNTMSDPTIPLTVGEWEEWGNPNEKKYFDYMSKYCPYSNIQRQNYPALLVTAGLFDPRVAYWEPAKFVSKLREHKTDSNLLMMKTDLSSGHFSASDRYKDLREKAFEMTFVLSQIAE